MCASVCPSVSVCLMPYFSDTVSLYVEIEVTTASVQHGADYYKKGFFYKCFVQMLWCHLFNHNILQGYCSDILCIFSTAEPSKGPKKANNRPNTTWNTT